MFYLKCHVVNVRWDMIHGHGLLGFREIVRFELEDGGIEITSLAQELSVIVGVPHYGLHVSSGVNHTHLAGDRVLVSMEHQMLIGQHVQ